MIRQEKRRLAIEIICFLLITLFVYAAANKILDFQKFSIQIGQSPLLTGFGSWLPHLVIGVELVVSVLLMIPRLRAIAMYAAFGLMVMFTAYIIAILNFSPYVPCSCGGVLEKMGWTEHLYFNFTFVLIGLIGVVLINSDRQELPEIRPAAIKSLARAGGILVTGVAIVALLMAFSGILRDQRNSFLRVFPSHPVQEDKSLDLEVNSFYFAGGTEHHIYLANYVDPLRVMILRHDLSRRQRVALDIAGIHDVPFWSARVVVDSPAFFLHDGAVPRIYKGSVETWRAERLRYDKEFFLDLVPFSNSSLALKSLTKVGSESSLARLGPDTPHFVWKSSVLKKQVDGVFCKDGMMAYDHRTAQLVYLYRYRNEFIVMDSLLNVKATGHTIDTNTVAKIKVALVESSQSHTMAAPPAAVNNRIAVHGPWLFVNSNLLAKNEHPLALEKSSVIDVYRLPEGSYQFSFYVYDYDRREKLRDFIVCGDHLFVMFDHHLGSYSLRPQYFVK